MAFWRKAENVSVGLDRQGTRYGNIRTLSCGQQVSSTFCKRGLFSWRDVARPGKASHKAQKPHFTTYLIECLQTRLRSTEPESEPRTLTMSRALDPDTMSSLGGDNLRTIYNDIVSALHTNTSGDDLLEIEFLGKSHPLPPGCNVLVDGNSIATTKAKLVQAFLVARQVFSTCVRDCPEEKEKELCDATAVMLLLDPEQLTAANARKRLVKKYEKRLKPEFEALLKKEMRFVDGYLTSRLHRHTKSPTLWAHRRWLREMSKKIGMQHDIGLDLKDVVLVAAERHPRNYYAWSHMRWLIQNCHDAPTCVRNASPMPTTDTGPPKIVHVVKDWCTRHPSDISGFSFLLFWLFDAAGEDLSTSARTDLCTSVCTDVLQYAVSFKWTHESVWVFLRTAVASNYAKEELRRAFTQAIEDIAAVQTKGQSILTAAKDWSERNQQRPAKDQWTPTS